MLLVFSYWHEIAPRIVAHFDELTATISCQSPNSIDMIVALLSVKSCPLNLARLHLLLEYEPTRSSSLVVGIFSLKVGTTSVWESLAYLIYFKFSEVLTHEFNVRASEMTLSQRFWP